MTLLSRRSRRIIAGAEGGGPVDPYADYLVYDDFHRADNPTGLGNAVKGGAWSYIDGNGTIIELFAISGNLAVAMSNTPTPIAYFDLGVTNYEIELAVNAFSGIAFRVQDPKNCWICAYDGGTTFDLVSYVNSELSVFDRFTEPEGHGVVNVKVVDDQITIKSNGVVKTTITDSYLADQTKIGFTGAAGNGDTFSYFWIKPVAP